jgi:protein TonB
VPSLNILHVGHDELAALDLAMATHHDRGQGEAAGDSSGRDSGDAGAAGGGAHGDQVALGDWVRRPTPAEMATYLEAVHATAGWGEVICRTAPRNRVEDCREKAESPGSGLARVLREASWQFLIFPTKVNGRAVIGGEVLIHYDLIEGFRRG